MLITLDMTEISHRASGVSLCTEYGGSGIIERNKRDRTALYRRSMSMECCHNVRVYFSEYELLRSGAFGISGIVVATTLKTDMAVMMNSACLADLFAIS